MTERLSGFWKSKFQNEDIFLCCTFSLCVYIKKEQRTRLTFCRGSSLQADPVMVLNDDNTIVITSNRLAETGAPLLEQGMIVGQLSLADVLIIGNCNNQVKNWIRGMPKIHFEK